LSDQHFCYVILPCSCQRMFCDHRDLMTSTGKLPEQRVETEEETSRNSGIED
jgi:hypothetical protein